MVGDNTKDQRVRAMTRISSFSERPISDRPRRLSDWLNPTGERKVHSLVDKVYKRKNLELAWYRVKRNKGAGGVDGVTLAEFEEHLDPLHSVPPGYWRQHVCIRKSTATRANIFCTARPVSGVFSEGFQMTELPATKARQVFQAQTATGKLNAVMTPHTPMGCHSSRIL